MKNKILSFTLAFLCILTAIPFTALHASAAEYTRRIVGPDKLSGFENPYASGGNFKINGMDIAVTEFDGVPVKAYSKSADAEKITASREVEGTVEYKENYSLNLFNYGITKDSGDKSVHIYDAAYVTVEYYYDTTGRDETDTFGSDLTANKMRFSLYRNFTNEKPNKGGPSDGEWTNTTIDASNKIAANQWVTETFNIKSAVLNKLPDFSSWYDAPVDGDWFGQWAFYPLGSNGGIQMYHGDVFYIRSLTFTSFDPASITSRNISYYASVDEISGGEPIISASANDLEIITLPDFPAEALPEGKLFDCWVEADSGSTYSAGSSFEVNKGADVNFYAKLRDPAKAYYSAAGTIDGVTDTVYSSMSEAVQFIADNGGIGTIIVDGDWAPAVGYESRFSFGACTDVTIKGYDSEASVTVCGTGHSYFYGNDTAVTFDDIKVVRGDGTADELCLALQGVNLTFGSGCTFTPGTMTYTDSKTGETKTKAVNLYIFQMNGHNRGYSLTFDGEIKTTQIAPLGGYSGSVRGITGDYNITINAGTHGELYATDRNGYSQTTNKSKITGNSTVTVNGGTITNFATAGYRSGCDLTGNSIVTVNGGKITNLYFGDQAQGTNKLSTVMGGMVLTVNAKSFVENGYALLSDTVIKDGAAVQTEKGVFVLNNTELYTKAGTALPKIKTAQYSVYVNGGTAIPDISGNAVKFKITSDDPSLKYVSANGKIISADSDGYYTLEKGKTNIIFTPFETIGDNIRFVSAAGSDTNSGYTSETPLASIDEAIKALGGFDGTVVIMDEVNQFFTPSLVGAAQSVTLTGKDPVTGEIYDAFIYRAKQSERPKMYRGHITLEHLGDYNQFDAANNIPYMVGDMHFTIGEGYKFYVNNSGTRTEKGVQINVNLGGANPVVDINSRISQIQLMDYGNSTVSGDLNINVGPKATFDGYFSLGGDTGSSVTTATVNGKTYITVDGSQCGKNIYLGGVKANSKTVLNGLQVILNNTNMTVANHEKGTYTNNGATYIVKVNSSVEGSAVAKSDEFGKVNITIPESYLAIVTSEDSTRQTYESSGKIALPEGNSTISFASSAVIKLIFDDGTEKEYRGGETVVFPAGTAPEGQLFYGWKMNGSVYFPGDELVLPNVSAEYNVTSVYAGTDSVVYIDMANGNDSNDGLSAETAFKTVAKVEKALATFKNTATMEIVGEYTYDDHNMMLPAYSGVLTVQGGTISSTGTIIIRCDSVFKDTTFNLKSNWKQIELNGKNVIFESTVKKAEGSMPLNIHAGKAGSNMEGDQSVEILGGNFAAVMAGPYYVSAGGTRTWNGNFDLKIGGTAKIEEVKIGDGYTGFDGKVIINGAVNVTVESGAALGSVNAIGYAASYDSFRIYNYGKATKLNNISADYNAKLYNFFDIAPVSIDGETMTFDSPANIVGGANTNESFVLACPADPGVYSVTAGLNVSDGLSIDGAQIRIANGTVEQGLRFIATYKDETAAKYEGKEYGYVVIPTAVLDGAPLDATKTYTFNSKTFDPAIVPAKILYELGDGFVRYTVCLLGIEANDYKTSYTVITYIKDGDSYVYGDTYAASVYDIANAAVAAHNDGTRPLDDNVLAAMNQIISDADAEGGVSQ